MYVNAIQGADENEFSVKIKCEYKDLYKLRDDAVPYVAPIRRVAHALQEPLCLELEKLMDEGILHNQKIYEKSEGLNSFVCV